MCVQWDFAQNQFIQLFNYKITFSAAPPPYAYKLKYVR